MQHNFQPNQNPEKLLRNLELRRDLDRMEARSEIQARESDGSSVEFSEGREEV